MRNVFGEELDSGTDAAGRLKGHCECCLPARHQSLQGQTKIQSAPNWEDSYRVQTRTELFDHLLAQDLAPWPSSSRFEPALILVRVYCSFRQGARSVSSSEEEFEKQTSRVMANKASPMAAGHSKVSSVGRCRVRSSRAVPDN